MVTLQGKYPGPGPKMVQIRVIIIFCYADFCTSLQKLLYNFFDFCIKVIQKYPYVHHCSKGQQQDKSIPNTPNESEIYHFLLGFWGNRHRDNFLTTMLS